MMGDRPGCSIVHIDAVVARVLDGKAAVACAAHSENPAILTGAASGAPYVAKEATLRIVRSDDWRAIIVIRDNDGAIPTDDNAFYIAEKVLIGAFQLADAEFLNQPDPIAPDAGTARANHPGVLSLQRAVQDQQQHQNVTHNSVSLGVTGYVTGLLVRLGRMRMIQRPLWLSFT
jgi:hypothetical protein